MPILTLAILLLAAMPITAHSDCDKMFPTLRRVLYKKVPELNRVAKYLERESAGKTHMIVRIESCPDSSATDTLSHNYYSLYVGEDHPDHTVRLYTFLIRKDLHTLLYYDLPADCFMTLTQARKHDKWGMGRWK